MNRNADEGSQGIFNLLFALSIGAAVGSVLTHHPMIIGLAVALCVFLALLKYTYSAMRDFLGKSSDLAISATFMLIVYMVYGRGEGAASPLKEAFAFIFWGSLILSGLFLKIYIQSFRKPDR